VPVAMSTFRISLHGCMVPHYQVNVAACILSLYMFLRSFPYPLLFTNRILYLLFTLLLWRVLPPRRYASAYRSIFARHRDGMDRWTRREYAPPAGHETLSNNCIDQEPVAAIVPYTRGSTVQWLSAPLMTTILP